MSQWLYYLDAIGMTLLGILFMALAIVVFLQDPRSHIHRAFAGIMTDLYVIDMLEILRLATIDPDIHLLSYRLTFAVAVLMIATVL